MAGEIREPGNPEGPKGLENSIPTVPDHNLLRQIAKGSYGEVWLGRSTLGSWRAVKVVRRNAFTDPRPYEREFKGIQRFEPISREHEALVDILQVGQNDEAGFFYYVMELADDANTEPQKPAAGGQRPVAGGPARNGRSEAITSACSLPPSALENYFPRTLAGEIKKGRLLPDETLQIVITLAEGLQHLHERGLVHRDIKPSNIIFVGGRPKLADVGLVAELDATLSVVGTIGYMPAEGPGSVQADIYSLGKVLYEAATGLDRQEFPNLPTLVDAADKEKLLELNEIFLKACAKEPAQRYQSATELLADLKLLQGGTSLRQAHHRRRTLKRAAAVAAVLLGVALVAGVLRITDERRVLFEDDFSSREINTNKWSWSTNWPPGFGAEVREGRVFQTNTDLVIEAKVQHMSNYTTFAGAWVDSQKDFRQTGACRIDLELAGQFRTAAALISISSNTPPADAEDGESVRLLTLVARAPEGELGQMNLQRISIVLLPDYRVAVVYPNAGVDEYEILNLAMLKEWRLRIAVRANSSFGFTNSYGKVQVRRVVARAEPASSLVIGFVSQVPTGAPVANAEVRDDQTMLCAKTKANGAFQFTAKSWPAHIWVRHEHFSNPTEVVVSDETRKLGPVVVQLKRLQDRFGDPLEVIACTNGPTHGIAFLQSDFCAMVGRGEGDASESVLWKFDSASGTFASEIAQFKTGDFPLGQLAWCGDRVLAVSAHPSEIYVLDLKTSQHSPVTKPCESSGRQLDFTYSCAFDGRLLWLLESDGVSDHFGLHALDPKTGNVVKSLTSNDLGINGLAWDEVRKVFWVSSLAKGEVYAVDPSKAEQTGRLEDGLGRSFKGNYTSLAFGNGYLWGVESERLQICKIKMTEGE